MTIEVAAENSFCCRMSLSRRSLVWGPWIDFMGSVNLNGEKVRASFSLASNLIACDFVVSVGSRIVYGLLEQKIFDMIYLLTADGLTGGGSSAVHIYRQYTEQHNETGYTERNMRNNNT